MRGPTSAGNEFYAVELAPLVNRVLAAGGTTLSLNVRRNPSAPRYFDFYTKDCATDAWRPRLLVTPSVVAAAIGPWRIRGRAPERRRFLEGGRIGPFGDDLP